MPSAGAPTGTCRRRAVPVHAQALHFLVERSQHGLAPLLVQRADGGHVAVQEAVLHHPGHQALVVAGVCRSAVRFICSSLGYTALGRHDAAQAQAGASTWGERAHVDAALGVAGRAGAGGASNHRSP